MRRPARYFVRLYHQFIFPMLLSDRAHPRTIPRTSSPDKYESIFLALSSLTLASAPLNFFSFTILSFLHSLLLR